MSSEHKIGERAVLAKKWIPNKMGRILDAGCDDGNNASLFSEKADKTWGVDINRKAIGIAKQNHPSINFDCCPIEKTFFEDNFFDVIVMNDVLEHVDNEIIAVNEMFRILKPGGQLIISTPHKGLFAFMDPANVKFLIKNKLLLYIVYGEKKAEKFITAGRPNKDFHRHYTLKQLNSILKDSQFKGSYNIEKVFRSGLLLGVLAVDMKVALSRLLGNKPTNIIMYPLLKIASLEYWIPFGPLAYNISISIKKHAQ